MLQIYVRIHTFPNNFTPFGTLVYIHSFDMFQLIIIAILRDSVNIIKHFMLKCVIINCAG